MNERSVVLLLTAAANLGLGLVVLFRNSSQQVNRRFAIFSVTLALWTLANGLVDAYAATQLGILWARAAFVAAAFIPLSFFLFVTVFPVSSPTPGSLARGLLISSGIIASLMSLTPLIAKATTSTAGILHVEYGPLHLYFGVYFLLASAYTLLFLTYKRTFLHGAERLQVRYVLLGVSVTGIGASITNLVVPLLFKSSQLSPFGPVLTLVLIGFIAHSIIRHRLMNIRLVIRRSITYSLTASIAGVTFIALVWSASQFLGIQPQELPLWGHLSMVLLITVAIPPLKNLIQTWINRYLFREPYDYQRAVREISRQMASILDLPSLLDYVSGAIFRTVRPEFIAVYTASAGSPHYIRIVEHRELSIPLTAESMSKSASLPRLLASRKSPVIADQIRRDQITTDTNALGSELARLSADLVFPLLEEDQLTGFLMLGRKRSGDPYFSEDLDLLETLVSQASIAIRNAELYSQVVLVNEYVENILATMESAVIAVDATANVTLFNLAAQRLTRLTLSQVKDRHLSILPASLAAPLQATLEDGQPRVQLETTVQDKAGSLTPAICSTSLLSDRTGRTLGAVGVFSDLTKLKSLEEQKRISERFAAIGALAAGLAHEIKNPLVAIKTFAELLPERFSEEDFRTDFSMIVIREIDRIDGLVARLRGLASAPTPQRVPLNPQGPLDETLALLRGQFEQAQVTLTTDYDADLPLVVGDAAQLKQLFLNLLVNALEATPTGSGLIVRAFKRKSDAVEKVVVEITDSGPGIPEALLGRIFDPFVTTKQSGSGLGLSICRGIADAHGAAIQATNNPLGRGATLTVEFPVYRPESIAVEPSYSS